MTLERRVARPGANDPRSRHQSEIDAYGLGNTHGGGHDALQGKDLR